MVIYVLIFLFCNNAPCSPEFLLVEFINLVVGGNGYFTFPVIVSLTLGGLVKKILETKKDYESSPSSPKSKEQVCTVVVAIVVSTRGQYQPICVQHIFNSDSELMLNLSISPISHSFWKVCSLGQVFLTTVKHWLLSKERYKQMGQRGVIALPCNHRNVPTSVKLNA